MSFSNQTNMTVECPMCFKEFNENDIEQHASNCGDSYTSSFSEEDSSSNKKQKVESDAKIEEDEEFNYEEKEEKIVEIEEEKKEEKEEPVKEAKKINNEAIEQKLAMLNNIFEKIEKIEEKPLSSSQKLDLEPVINKNSDLEPRLHSPLVPLEEENNVENHEEEKKEEIMEEIEEKKEEKEDKEDKEEKIIEEENIEIIKELISDKELEEVEKKEIEEIINNSDHIIELNKISEDKMEIEFKEEKFSSESEHLSEKKGESEEEKKDEMEEESSDKSNSEKVRIKKIRSTEMIDKKKEKIRKEKRDKPSEDRKRRDSRAFKKQSVTLNDAKLTRKKRAKTETVPPKTPNTPNREKSDPSMKECNNCQNYILPAQLYSLELCGHTYCLPCLRAGLRDVVTGKTTREPVCVTCQSAFTNSDIISIYNPRKYQKYSQKTMELLAANRLSPATVCNKCSKPIKFGRRLFILPEITDDTHRERFMSSPSKDIDRILYRAEHTCKMTCKKCEAEVCFLCGKESGNEFAHPPIFCPIVFSIMISEILDCIDTLTYRFYGLQLTKKDNNDANSAEKKASSNAQSSVAKGVGFDGSVSDNYSGVAVAHQKENQQRAIICNLIVLLTSIISSSSYVFHPSLFPLVHNSCLVPLLVNYFRTDWLMDVSAQQGELYFAVLSLLKAMSAHPALIGIFTYPLAADSEACLLDNITTLSKQASFVTKQAKSFEGQENSKAFNVLGLALDIQSTVSYVEEKVAAWKSTKLISYFSPIKPKEEIPEGAVKTKGSRASRIFKRKSTIRKLAKEEKIIILDDPKKRDEFYVSHLRAHQFEFMCPYPKSLQNVRYTSEYQAVLNQSSLSPEVMIRLSQELSSLAASLPISPSSGIYMRVNEEKINLMRFIIIGPEDTPYAFVFFSFLSFPLHFINLTIEMDVLNLKWL